MEDVKEERQWRESMGRRAERIMRRYGIDEEFDAGGEGGLGLTEGMLFFFFFSPLFSSMAGDWIRS